MEIIGIAIFNCLLLGVVWMYNEYQYKLSNKKQTKWRHKMGNLTQIQIDEMYKNYQKCSYFNGDISNWDVSKHINITDVLKNTKTTKK